MRKDPANFSRNLLIWNSTPINSEISWSPAEILNSRKYKSNLPNVTFYYEPVRSTMVQGKVKDTNHANVDHKPLNTGEKIMFRKDPDAKNSIWQSGTITEKIHNRKYRIKPMIDSGHEITHNRIHLKPSKIKPATKTPAKTMAQVLKLDNSVPASSSIKEYTTRSGRVVNAPKCLGLDL